MGETIGVDRRKARRFDLVRLVVYKHFDIEKITKTINISMGGMKIRTEFPVEQDERLDVSIKIGDKEFESGARVVYCKETEEKTYNVGLMFEGTVPEQLRLLNRFLSETD